MDCFLRIKQYTVFGNVGTGIAQDRCFVRASLTPSFDMHRLVVSVRARLCFRSAAFIMCRPCVQNTPLRFFFAAVPRSQYYPTLRRFLFFSRSILSATFSIRCITACTCVLFCNLDLLAALSGVGTSRTWASSVRVA